jgi:6-phospho-beta-glucosidase
MIYWLSKTPRSLQTIGGWTYSWAKYPQAPFDYLARQGLAPTIEDGTLNCYKKSSDFMGVTYYYTLTYESNPLDGVSEGAFNTTGKRAALSQVLGL